MGGSPKGLEIVGGQRIVDRVAGVLEDACGRVILAANDDTASAWLAGVPVVRDRHPGAGGLAGVEAAMRHSGDVIVVAWDMPFVPAGLLHALREAAHERDANVVLPESDSPYGFEPFCAFYSSRILPRLAAFVDQGGGAARDFLSRVKRVHRVPLRSVSQFGDPGVLFLSVNTPEDLSRARTVAASRH